jgi:hypothetical protein
VYNSISYLKQSVIGTEIILKKLVPFQQNFKVFPLRLVGKAANVYSQVVPNKQMEGPNS